MIQVQEAIDGLKLLLGKENVATDEETLLTADGWMHRTFEKMFGYEPEYLPICVVKVFSTEEVAKVMKYCTANDLHIIVKTGGSSSEDNLTTVTDRTVMVDASGMDQLFLLDDYNMVATVGCGMPLEKLEAIVNEKGLTTGHCPQSIPLAQMGGLVATRSTGQFSTYYGGIEDLVCGLEAVLPDGEVVRIRNVPRRAAGPDLRHLFIGSEGAFAIITEVTVKLFTYYPDDFWKGAYIADSFDTGVDVIREILVKGYKPSVVRLYDKADMDYNYTSVKLEKGEVCMFFVAEGPPDLAEATGRSIDKIALSYEGVRPSDVGIVDHWLATRNNINDGIISGAYFEAMRKMMMTGSTLEVSANWSEIKNIYKNVMENLPKKIKNLVLLGGHVSHSYQTGTNIYFVYGYKPESLTDTTVNEGWKIIEAICEEVLKEPTGGIAHHHGLGKVRTKLLDRELGSSYPLMEKLKMMFDPEGTMNPGVIIPLKDDAK